MTEINSFKDEAIRVRVKALGESEFAHERISEMVGIPRRTITDFLAKSTYKEWWDDNSEPSLPAEQPSIYFVDIETSPLQVWTWGLFNQNIAINQIEKDWEILCCGVKKYGDEKKILLTAAAHYTSDHTTAMEDMIVDLWHVFNDADIIVAHNGRKFDNKKIKAKFKEFKLPPPSPYKVVDTLEIARREFAFTSNKQDYLAQKLGSTGKLATGGMQLWLDCMDGVFEAWERMHDYCGQDINDLELLYVEFRGWDKKHPNLQMYYGDDLDRCGNCGSLDVKVAEGEYTYTSISKFELTRCSDCGAYRRLRENLTTKESRKNKTMNII